MLDSRFLNLIGAQAAMYFFKSLKKINPIRISFIKHPEAAFLLQHGYIQINNFLGEARARATQNFFDYLVEKPGNANIVDNDTTVHRNEFTIEEISNVEGFSFVKDITLKANEILTHVTDERINEQSVIWFDKIMNGQNPSSQSSWHTDIYRDVYKIWYFPFGVSEENGPLELGLGSHKFSLNRMFLEYLYSNKKNITGRGSWHFTTKELATLFASSRKFCCNADTLVIVNTHALHRRSIGKPGSNRKQCHISIRSY